MVYMRQRLQGLGVGSEGIRKTGQVHSVFPISARPRMLYPVPATLPAPPLAFFCMHPAPCADR
jgi:hypothetical protein